MIVLDATVLIYAMGTAHPLRQPCRDLVKAIADGEIEATTTVEAIQEFVHVRARRRSRADAVASGTDYAELLSPLLNVTAQHLRRGLALLEGSNRLGAFDAVLAAAAEDVGTLVSADTALADVPELAHLVPDEAGVAELLSTSG